MITIEEINQNIAKYDLTRQDIIDMTGINKSTLSLWLNGRREMTQAVAVMFYYLFETLKLREALKETVKAAARVRGEVPQTTGTRQAVPTVGLKRKRQPVPAEYAEVAPLYEKWLEVSGDENIDGTQTAKDKRRYNAFVKACKARGLKHMDVASVLVDCF
jgi:transcriptional regulator with XRE-family HTH domain